MGRVARPGLAVLLAISGCSADYLNHYDSVTLAAGDANRANSLAQTVDPFNPNSNNTRIEGDGARSVAVIQQYKPGGGGYKGNCEYSDQKASNGSSCGGRSAEARPGGFTPPPEQ